MSDPVSNAEIEDVLSSIRRLVSVNERPERAEEDASASAFEPEQTKTVALTEPLSNAEEESEPQQEERLVLSPSFRIDSDDAGDAQAPSDEEAQNHLTLEQWQVDTGEDHAEDSDAEQLTASENIEEAQGHEEPGAGLVSEGDWLSDDPQTDEASEPQAAAWEHDHTDEGNDEPTETGLIEDEDVAFEYADMSSDQTAENAENNEEAGGDTSVTSELEARIAEVEAAVAAREDQWEPDGVSEDAYAGSETEPLPWEDHTEADAADVAQDADEDLSTDDAPAAAAVSTLAFSARAGADTDQDDVVGSDASERTEESESESATQPHEASPDRFKEPSAHTSDQARDAWYSEETDAILDENALRDLVSEIVRQELQGTLGERITRNVRKLVRREIHRAMMGQDFD